MFVFDLETSHDQEFAEVYAAALYDVNRLRDWWDRDLTAEEILPEREYVTVFIKSCGNPVMNMLKYIQKTMKVLRELLLIKKVMKYIDRTEFYFWHITVVGLIVELCRFH